MIQVRLVWRVRAIRLQRVSAQLPWLFLQVIPRISVSKMHVGAHSLEGLCLLLSTADTEMIDTVLRLSNKSDGWEGIS